MNDAAIKNQTWQQWEWGECPVRLPGIYAYVLPDFSVGSHGSFSSTLQSHAHEVNCKGNDCFSLDAALHPSGNPTPAKAQPHYHDCRNKLMVKINRLAQSAPRIIACLLLLCQRPWAKHLNSAATFSTGERQAGRKAALCCSGGSRQSDCFSTLFVSSWTSGAGGVLVCLQPLPACRRVACVRAQLSNASSC